MDVKAVGAERNRLHTPNKTKPKKPHDSLIQVTQLEKKENSRLKNGFYATAVAILDAGKVQFYQGSAH